MEARGQEAGTSGDRGGPGLAEKSVPPQGWQSVLCEAICGMAASSHTADPPESPSWTPRDLLSSYFMSPSVGPTHRVMSSMRDASRKKT